MGVGELLWRTFFDLSHIYAHPMELLPSNVFIINIRHEILDIGRGIRTDSENFSRVIRLE